MPNSAIKKSLLITGGAGFIGSHLVRRLVTAYPQYHIYNLDALTYAGNLENLKDISQFPNYTFIKGDINDAAFISALFSQHRFDGVIHLAAESHVDRSISDPLAFVNTNIVGTVNLLNAARDSWKASLASKRFYHISTDEVFGSLGEEGFFNEDTSYKPNSPYAAAKASSDHFVRAYGATYNLPYVISNCSNNYGPNQFPEKLIPLCIKNIMEGKELPVYGDGKNSRDWLFVEDHVRAIDLIYHKGKTNETYAVGGICEVKNIDLVKRLCQQMDVKLGQTAGTSERLISFVKDRLGHDFRYAIDTSKVVEEIGWKPELSFEEGLDKTIDWYMTNSEWLQHVSSGEYQKYYEKMYG